MDLVEGLVPDRHVPLAQSALVRQPPALVLRMVDDRASDQAVPSDWVAGSPSLADHVGAVPDPDAARRSATQAGDRSVVETGGEQLLAQLDPAEPRVVGLASGASSWSITMPADGALKALEAICG